MDILPIDREHAKAGARLHLTHLEELRRSGLSDSQIEACGFYTETNPNLIQKLLGWKFPARNLGACLCVPFRDAEGQDTGHVMVKPDKPRQKNGKSIKYESPAGASLRVYIPPNTRAALADPSVPLVITEGMKKAAKADQDGFLCLGLAGVYGWSKKRPVGPDGKKIGPRELIPDLAAVAWHGRTIIIVFDSDITSKPEVARAEWQLGELLTAAGAVVKVVRLPAGTGGGKVGLDDYLLAHSPEALRHLVEAAQPPTKPTGTKKEVKKPPSAADVLAAIGSEFDLWHDATQTGFATAGRHSYLIKSKVFRQLLTRDYRKSTGKVPNSEAMTAALATIEADAVHDGPEYAVHVRVAEYEGRVYLHLADKDSTVIEIDAEGWRECPNPPVRFRKPAGMLALPMPQRGGSLDRLREFLNVPDRGGFTLVVAWLMGCFRPQGPFPALVLLGEQGSAKTTTARVVKKLIDPSAAAVRSEPKEARDLMIQGRNGLVLAFDNLSHLPPWLSDAFCRLATGGGFSTRELYTDEGEVIFDAKRPLVVNGIEDFITRADLLERSLLIRHPPIPEEKRRPESEFWADFDAAHPKLLGALLDRVSAGLRELPSTKLGSLPRMADFALFAVACERGVKEEPGFLSAYADNQAGAHEQALDASPLPAALLTLMEGRDLWHGTPTELHAELSRFAPQPEPKDWPKKPNAMTGKLTRLAPNLRRVHGLHVEDGRESGGSSGGKRSRFIRITRRSINEREAPSPSSPGTGDPVNVGDVGLLDGDDAGGRCDPLAAQVVSLDRPRPNDTDSPPFATEAVRGDGGDSLHRDVSDELDDDEVQY